MNETDGALPIGVAVTPVIAGVPLVESTVHCTELAVVVAVTSSRERILPEGHLHRAITESNLGESLVALERHAEALQRFAAAEPVARAAGQSGEELLLLLLRNKAKALQGTGEVAAARVALEQARALLKRDPGRAQEFAEVEQALAQLQVRAG